MKQEIKIFYSKDWIDYELLDTGEGEKLERFGKYIFVRPHEEAVWSRDLSISGWEKNDGRFTSGKKGEKGRWNLKKDLEKNWILEYKGIKFLVSPTPFRHFGFFPEQAAHWDFIEEKIKNSGKKIKFLNLFGYTGLASLFALRAGAEVTHLDASKQSLNWAKENQKLNPDLAEAPMRVIEDDAIKFLEREEKRGNKYDAIIMDPPKFGRGPKGEIWKIEERLSELLFCVRKVLSDKPLFVILNSYSTDSATLSFGYALEDALCDLGGRVDVGELCLLEKSQTRLISLAKTAIWTLE